jgi:hypothetical protein
MRYCAPARTFLGVSDRSALQLFTIPDRLHERSVNVCESSMNVFNRSMRVFDRFRPFVTVFDKKSLETVRNVGRSETVNDQGRWKI